MIRIFIMTRYRRAAMVSNRGDAASEREKCIMRDTTKKAA